MKIRFLLLSLALLGVCNSALAQWQWLDKDGRKVFSDRAPPSEVPDRNILKRPASAKPAPSAAPAANEAVVAAMPADKASSPASSGLEKELAAKKKQAAEAEAAKRQAEEARITKAKIENCAMAKQSMATLESGVRLTRTNAAGEPEVMDDMGRAAERKRIQNILDGDCR